MASSDATLTIRVSGVRRFAMFAILARGFHRIGSMDGARYWLRRGLRSVTYNGGRRLYSDENIEALISDELGESMQ